MLMRPPAIAKLISNVALRLFACGAETRLIVQISERLAVACGSRAVVAVSPNMIHLKIVTGLEEYSSFWRTGVIGMDTAGLIACTRLCRRAERGEVTLEQLSEAVSQIRPSPYNSYLMILVISLATCSFCMLNGGSIGAALTSMLAGAVAMSLKLAMHHLRIFPMLVFICCGFAGTVASFVIGYYCFRLGNFDLSVAMVVSLLPFVPGFPFINGILDLFKGYPVMGINRLLTALMLLASVCIGIVLALGFLPLKTVFD